MRYKKFTDKFIDKILLEVSYRTKDGIVNFSRSEDIKHFLTVLDEFNMGEIGMEWVGNLLTEKGSVSTSAANRAKEMGLQHIAFGFYSKNGEKPATHKAEGENIISVSPDEFEKVAAEKSGETPSDKGGESGEGGVSGEPERGTAFNPQTKGGEAYLKNLPDGDPAKPDEFIKKEPTKRIIAGKDKTLKSVDSLSTEVFNQSIEPSDDEFENRNAKLANPIPPPPFSFGEFTNRKFPKKYISVLERMMNTKATGDATKWSHFSDLSGGAGQISAQAGELMVMMGVSMSDTDFEQFTDALLEYEKKLIEQNPDLKSESKRIISKSWIEAAKNNRSAILKRLQKEYPESEIVATAWDTENDVNALGLENYNENKGFSTDVYLKIKTKDGEEILDEVSLKKSTMVYFLNSGAGKFSQWDENLPDEINQNVYRDKSRERLVNFGKGIESEIQSILEKGGEDAETLNSLFKSKKVDFKTAISDTENGKGSRGKSKVILESIKLLAENGNAEAQNYLEETSRLHKEFQTAAIKAITENPKMKQGMLQEIRSEFPLKAVSEGEETMAIGPNSLDKKVMEEIFGTSDFEKIKEKLTAESGPPPYIGYKAEVSGKVIPLAEINIREDGVGYGGQVKFEMQLDKRFAKVLEKANRKVYS